MSGQPASTALSSDNTLVAWTALWPRWFLVASLTVGLIGLFSVPIAAALTLAILLVASRALWDRVLVLLLGLLSLATSTLNVAQPAWLRYLVAVVLTLMGAVSWSRFPRSGREQSRPTTATQRYAVLVMMFLVAAAAGILTSDFPFRTLEAVTATAAILILPIALTATRWRRQALLTRDLVTIQRFLWMLTAIGLAEFASSGLAERATGIHTNPNTYGYVAMFGFALTLGLQQRMTRRTGRLVLVIALFGIIASGSRGALAGALAAVAYLSLRRSQGSARLRVAALLALIGAALLILPVPGPLDLQGVYARTFEGDAGLDLSGRQARWATMLNLATERPVLGHGLRSTDVALGGWALRAGASDASGGHNSYLTVLAETGVIGLLLLFGAVAMALRYSPPQRGEAAAAWVAASAVVVSGLVHMAGESFVLGIGGLFPLVFWSSVAALTLTGGARTLRARASRASASNHPHHTPSQLRRRTPS